jgi:hypothetical protein
MYQQRGRLIKPSPSPSRTHFEPMICMDCETITTTDDPFIRLNSRVLCAKCEGFLMLLHQYEDCRSESPLDILYREVLDSSL